MKVAVATAGERVSPHFGHAPGFTVANVSENGVSDIKYFDNNDGNCQSLPVRLSQMGVSVAIVGGIGQGSIGNLRNHGIEILGGISGSVNDVLDAFVRGDITCGELGCSHHDDDGCGGHEHGHGHGHHH